MLRPLAAVLVFLIAVLVSVPPPEAHGCAVIPPKGGKVGVSSEDALIVYDSATKTEHFIRTAAFNASASADFGFMVPTPSKPELAEASADVFGALAEITKPRTVVERRPREPEFGCGANSRTFTHVGAAVGPPGPKPDVTVVEQKRVGGLDAAVLKADDPKALRDWLGANGYDARPQLEEWFEAYTASKWYLTAFKIAAENGKGGATVHNTAVRISFQTDTPFYPYREPADARAAGGAGVYRRLRLFVLSDVRVAGFIGRGEHPSPIPAQTAWSNRLTPEQRSAVQAAGKLLPLGEVSGHLTEFDDRSSPRPGTDEVYLSASLDQTTVERPPIVKVEYYDPPLWPIYALMVSAPVLVLLVGLVVWRVLTAKKAV